MNRLLLRSESYALPVPPEDARGHALKLIAMANELMAIAEMLEGSASSSQDDIATASLSVAHAADLTALARNQYQARR